MTNKNDTFTASELEVVATWAVEIRESGCQSFVEVALRLPALWSALRFGHESRSLIAELLGWPHTLEAHEIGVLGPLEIGNRLLNIGGDNVAELWFRSPRTCNALHRAGKLRSAIEVIGLDSPVLMDEGTQSLSVEALRRYGTIEGWFRSDFDSFRTAIRDGVFSHIAETFPPQPRQGWSTAGGRVHGVARLVVARILEVHGISFKVAGVITDVIARKVRLAPAFFLPVQRLSICFGDPRHIPETNYSGLDEVEFRYVVVDEGLLGFAGWHVAFVHHVIQTLEDAGVNLSACEANSTYADLMSPEGSPARKVR